MGGSMTNAFSMLETREALLNCEEDEHIGMLETREALWADL